MVVHVGFIAPGLGVPPIIASTESQTGGSIVTATLGAPTGIQAGMPMVACVSAGAYAQFGPITYGYIPDPAWTPVYEEADNGLTNWIIPNLYSKIADADDEAGTASYSWTVNAGESLGGIAVAILGWPARYGATISNPAADYTTLPSLASPGGIWQLTFITQRTSAATPEADPDPQVTSAATLLVDKFSPGTDAYRAGQIRVYGSPKVSPITGAYPSPPANNRQAMVTAAVSR